MQTLLVRAPLCKAKNFQTEVGGSAASDEEHQLLVRFLNDQGSRTSYIRRPSFLTEPQGHLMRSIVVGEHPAQKL